MLPGCDTYKTIIEMEDPTATPNDFDAVIMCSEAAVQSQLCDMGNSEYFNFQNIDFILMCFSIDDRQSFDNIRQYVCQALKPHSFAKL